MIAHRLVGTILAGALLIAPWRVSAQPVSLDRGVQAAGLWCFPLANDPKQ